MLRQVLAEARARLDEASRALEGTETVLVVEDDDDVRRIMRGSLARRGYHVLDAQNGDEALHIADQHAGDIDLLVTDVVMPRMSGVVVANRMVATRPSLRVLYVSGHSCDVGDDARTDAATSFLRKPFTPDLLAGTVRALLEGHAVSR